MMRARTKGRQTDVRRGATSAHTSFDELPDSALGHIDTYGHLAESAGWWLVGWMPRPFQSADEVSIPARLETAHGATSVEVVLAYFERPDLDHSRVGVIAYVGGTRRLAEGLRRLLVRIDGVTYGMQATLSTSRADDRGLYDLVRPTLVFQSADSAGREHLRGLSSRPGYVGVDTLNTIASVVALDVDAAIVCPPDGLLLKGWCLSVSEQVAAVRLRCGAKIAEISFADCVPVHRPDVIEALGARYGVQDPVVGFMAYLPNIYQADEPLYFEVELKNGGRAYRGVTVSRQQGLEAIRAVLEGTECQFADIDTMFDRVFGPAVRALNAARLAQPFTVEAHRYGSLPPKPTCTLVIPLYGRIDYLEYQMALLSADPASHSLDIVYVLDDPPKRRDALMLAESVYARFRLPFRLLLSSANRGFGPASNLGLAYSEAPYVAFMNSDVFPGKSGWLDALTARLKRQPKLGAIGPRLLYEDGSVQHEGCVYRPLPEYSDWHFVDHPNKGRRPEAGKGVLIAPVITAACLVMKRDIANDLKGFDESFIIGDFEDADLCQRLAAKGLQCAVDTDVVLHHLERQSQNRLSGHWRMNLTLYNAWLHQRRWFAGSTPRGGR